MTTNTTPRRTRSGAIAAIALAALAMGAPSCKKEAPPPAPVDPPKSFVPESYPIRVIYIANRKNSKDPKLPPRSEAEVAARTGEALAKVRAPGASFEQVASEMSDDAQTAADGGFVGFVADWTRDIDVVVKAARALKVGEISSPVAIELGIEIIKRLSREEGKAVEEKYVAPVDTITAPWRAQMATLPADYTKEASYEEVVKVLIAVRAGEYDLAIAQGKLLAAQYGSFPVRRVMPPGYEKFVAAVFAAKPEGIIDPIETPEGWVIARRLPYVRCYGKHIVFTSERSPKFTNPSTRSQAEAHALAQTVLDRLRKDPDAWDQIAKEVSEDSGSKNVGGFAGDFSNALVPARRAQLRELESAVWRLAPGAISDLIDTDFGVHIVKRVD